MENHQKTDKDISPFCFLNEKTCLHQDRMEKEKQRVYDSMMIDVFFIADFSTQSKLFYEWRIKPLMHVLKNYMYIDEKFNLQCYPLPLDEHQMHDLNVTKIQQTRVTHSNLQPCASLIQCANYCQPIHRADIVVIDLATQQEELLPLLDIAIALDRWIVPICRKQAFKLITTTKNTIGAHVYEWLVKNAYNEEVPAAILYTEDTFINIKDIGKCMLQVHKIIHTFKEINDKA